MICHGAWCWYKIKCLMETSGYKVTCLDLKSAGLDHSNPNEISTFDEYNTPLVILVGHSAGGLSLTDAIYIFPNKIHLAVYVAATMLKDGFFTDEDFRDGDPDLSEYGDISEFESGMGVDQPPTSFIIRKEFQRDVLYQMSPKEDSTLASMLLRPAPIRALKPQFVGESCAHDTVPRVYIKTLQDHVLKPVQQEAMIRRWQPFKVKMSGVRLAKQQFVLVHGYGHGAWCWYKGTRLLKSCGIDRADPNTIASFDEYNAPLVDFFSNLPENDKVVLVSHSAGGLSLTDVTYRFRSKIHLAIYVAAIMLEHGLATDQDFKDAMPDLSDISEVEYGLGPDQPPTSSIVMEEFRRETLYKMSPPEDCTLASMLMPPAPSRAITQFAGGKDVDLILILTLASMLLRPAPIRSLKPKFVGESYAHDTVPCVYIKTLLDHVLKPVQQEAMIRRRQPFKVKFEGVKMSGVRLAKQHFVLVHGASHGAWCWYKVRCLLETSGHKVSCLDLKGCGIDRADPNTIASFDEYNAPLVDFFSNLPENEKVVLVGHSAGGLSLTDVTYRFPSKIHLAIYVAATMLEHGFATDQDFKDALPDLSEYGDITEAEYGLGPDQPPTSNIIKKEFCREIFYNMSPPEDCTLALMLMRPSPTRVITQFAGGKDVDVVPRVYIRTLNDHILKQAQQEAMIKRWQPSQVFVLESDHSPFFSTPSLLFNYLVKAAESIQ
ncbi:hypothetical protein Tsubulata_007335 [Turnera subulata]|uniref:AB hydrolase-1 domain-containing protein n=1 Tax=Turnera subulata TaxID=218843 RepID=A0A9Q0FMR6_9ROSI|nr:hypothetical protein Tsubulata_007335 [Turnera subulata]